MHNSRSVINKVLYLSDAGLDGGLDADLDAGLDTNVEVKQLDTTMYIPTHDDFCAIMSCVMGQPSERHLFIPKLAEQILTCRENDSLTKLVTNASQKMKSENKTQIPILCSTLRGEFCPANINQIVDT